MTCALDVTQPTNKMKNTTTQKRVQALIEEDRYLLFYDEVLDHNRAIRGNEIDDDVKKECAEFIRLALLAVRAVNKARRAIRVG